MKLHINNINALNDRIGTLLQQLSSVINGNAYPAIIRPRHIGNQAIYRFFRTYNTKQFINRYPEYFSQFRKQ